MSGEDVRRIIEEATKESLNQSFTEAGRKFVEAAMASEQRGDMDGAGRLYGQAADAFLKAAEKYRASKSYKNAALNMCAAGDLYSELAEAESAMKAYQRAAEDLFSASDEHLMWGEEAETKKGTALAVVASMVYMMIGMESEGFKRAKAFTLKNSSKLRYPATVRISEIPQMLEGAIRSVDISAFSSAETAAVTELKSALINAGAQDFVKYVDKGLDMVREILRGQLKTPKVTTRLELPIDATFKEPFPVTVHIINEGDGDALNLSVEWFLDDELVFVTGEKKRSFSKLPAGTEFSLEMKARAANPDLMGTADYQVMLRGSYLDMLKTEYTLQAGPGSVIVRDFKMTEKLMHDIDVSDGRVGLLGQSVRSSKLEKAPLLRLLTGLESSLLKAREEIRAKDLDSARARIGVVNEVIDTIDSLLGDDALVREAIAQRDAEKKAYARALLTPVRETLSRAISSREDALRSEIASSLTRWDADATNKMHLAQGAKSVSTGLQEVTRELESLYAQLPAASGTESPEEAARRTKIRTWVESLKSKVAAMQVQAASMSSNQALVPVPRPSIPERIELALRVLREVSDEVGRTLEAKSAELGV
ncbi:MAG: hypothetical protein HXY34_05165 [Candidatus Thorarchaeota archaeon]|nr:hypothetical protein [Candidatus Thorarchaeota archaeon]